MNLAAIYGSAVSDQLEAAYRDLGEEAVNPDDFISRGTHECTERPGFDSEARSLDRDHGLITSCIGLAQVFCRENQRMGAPAR